MKPEDIALRAATSADTDFVVQVAETTMRGYVERAFGKFDPEANRKGMSEKVAAGTCGIILFQGASAGILCVEYLPTHIQLDQLFILPGYQNRGIGTWFVRSLAHEARETRRPIRLRVLNVNPARKLYEREGFCVTSTTPERTYMELPGSKHAEP